jgi:hypothetical protein
VWKLNSGKQILAIFRGYVLEKHPTNSAVAVHEVKTIWKKMGLKDQRQMIHHNM